MVIPLLGNTPSGICIVCKGTLGKDHAHEYIDSFERKLLSTIADLAIALECVIPTDQGLLPAHPKLAPGYMWYPVEVTNSGAHEECNIDFPHHHCGEDDNAPSTVTV